MPPARQRDKFGDGALVARCPCSGEIVPGPETGGVVGRQAVLVFGDYTCPFSFLAATVVARLRADRDVQVGALELRPAGTPLPPPEGAWPQAQWESVVAPLAEQLAVGIRYPLLSTRTRKAHEAVAHARTAGMLWPMHEAVYRAWWQEQRDIGRIDVLAEIAAEAGLDRTAMKVALDIDQCAERVEQDAVLAQSLEVTVVPAIVQYADTAQARILTGFQRHDELIAWMMDEHDV